MGRCEHLATPQTVSEKFFNSLFDDCFDLPITFRMSDLKKSKKFP